MAKILINVSKGGFADLWMNNYQLRERSQGSLNGT